MVRKQKKLNFFYKLNYEMSTVIYSIFDLAIGHTMRTYLEIVNLDKKGKKLRYIHHT